MKYQVEITPVRAAGVGGWIVAGLLLLGVGMCLGHAGSTAGGSSAQVSAPPTTASSAATGLTVQNATDEAAAATPAAEAAASETANMLAEQDPADEAAGQVPAAASGADAQSLANAISGRVCRRVLSGEGQQLYCKTDAGGWALVDPVAPDSSAEAAADTPPSMLNCRSTPGDPSPRSCGAADGRRRELGPESASDGAASSTAPTDRCETATAAFRRANGDRLSPADYHAFYQRCLAAAASRPDALAGLF